MQAQLLGLNAGTWRQEPEDGAPDGRLAGARFTDNADGLSLGDRETHLLHGADGATARRELDGEITHIEEWDRGHVRCAAAGR